MGSKLTHTVSGSVASFKSADKADITHLKAHFLPVQEGTGDPSPSNERAIRGWTNFNVNKAKKNVAHIVGYSASSVSIPTGARSLQGNYGTTINTTDYALPDTPVVITQTEWPNSSNKASYQNGYIFVVVDNLIFNEYYDISFRVTNILNNPLDAILRNIPIYMPDGANAYSDEVIGDRIIYRNKKFTQYANRPDMKGFDIRACGMSFTISEIMVTPANKNDGVFEAYSNTKIPVTIPSVGKNLLSPFIKDRCVNVTTGYEIDGAGCAVTDYIPVDFSTNSSYYLSGIINDYHSFVAAYNADKVFLGRCGGDQRSSLQITTSIFTVGTPQGTGDIKYLRVEQYNITDMSDLDSAQMQLEAGSSATTYEPFDYLCYGGYVDIVTGDIVAEYNRVIVDGSEGNAWYYTAYNGVDYARVNIQTGKNFGYSAKSSGDLLFNYAKKSGGLAVWNGFISSQNDNILLYIPSTIESKNDWLEYLSEHPLEIIYELKNPVLVGVLTPIELQAFAGQNNIWSDANGDTEVEYEFTDYMNKRRISLNEPHLVTMTGKLITFETDMVAPLEIIGDGNITVSGKNMLDPATHSGATTFTSNGITFSQNADGSVTVNGKIADASKASPQFTYTFTAPFSGNVYFCSNSPYTGTYTEIYMYDTTLRARCRQWNGVSNGLSSSSARPICEAQFVAGHATGLNIRINRQYIIQYDNAKISPMILAPTCTDTTFEEYKGATLPASTRRVSFKGINNIWSDSGNDITVRYWTHI